MARTKIEGRTPLRVHHDVGEKTAAKPRGVDTPSPTTTLRRSRLDDYAPSEPSTLKLPVKVQTSTPIAPTRIRKR